MYKPVIGLEIHVELNTKSKMFCGCANDPDEKRPNFNVCPICMGHPGTLPVINQEAVVKVIKTGLALNCNIPENSKFDRKNYFYPDLPKGYQISQYDQPLCKEGYLNIDGRQIRVRRVHLEEDTGRLIHEQGEGSLVDLNRAGVPLMELVTDPDIETGVEARRFAEDLRLILRYLGVSKANMEKGEMRCEVNISLSKNPPAGGGVLGTKAEIKNLNSFRAVEKSIEYEIKRQTELLDKGEKIIQETRGWDDIKGKTVSQREKEEAHDYRYFPEPDLPSLHFTKEDILKIKEQIVELPEERKQRFIKEYGLSRDNVGIFSIRKELGDFFEKTAYELKAWVESEKGKKIDEGEFQKLAKIASNYLISDLLGILKEEKYEENDLRVTPENFAELVKTIYLNKISSKAAKTVLLEMVKNGKDPSQIIEEMGLVQVTDEGEIGAIIKEAIDDPKNKKAIDDFKSGKESALQFVVGQIMAKTKGKANPQSLKELLKKALTK